MPPRERLGYVLLGCLLLFAIGFVGARHLKAPTPIVFEEFNRELHGPATAVSPSAGAGDSGSEGAAATLLVHVAGAIAKPGVVRLSASSRVQDALREAGGPKPDADLDALNLAAPLEDGSQLYVPRKGAPDGRPAQAYGGGAVSPSYSAPPPGSGAAPEPAGPRMVSLNTATAAQLETLPGIGPATAAKILEYRRVGGGFRSVDELLQVKGIGPKKFAEISPYLRL